MQDYYSVSNIDNVIYNSWGGGSIPLLSSHLYISMPDEKKKLIDIVWLFLNNAYNRANIEFKSFANKDDMISNSLLWKIIYDGEIEDIDDVDINKCYAVGIYKKKAGLKRVASGVNPLMPSQKRKSAYKKLITTDFKIAWTECSGAVEKTMMKYGGEKYIIDPIQVKKVFPTINILDDGIHYIRTLSAGLEVIKVAIGTIKI